MTREQDDRIEQIARLSNSGRVHVNRPYSDGSVEVTIPNGACWLVDDEGHLTVRPFNHNVDWNLT